MLRTLRSLLLFGLCLAYVVLLGLSIAAPPEPTTGFDMVLTPLPDGPEVQRRQTTAGHLHARRACFAGRCEVLFGAGPGFPYLVSYPSNRVVLLAHDGSSLVIDRSDIPSTSSVSRVDIASSAVFIGLILVFWLGWRLIERAEGVCALRESRSATVKGGWELGFDDEMGPTVAVLDGRVPVGPATATRLLRTTHVDQGPYRGATIERWKAIPGTPWDNMVREARAFGGYTALATCLGVLTLARVVALLF